MSQQLDLDAGWRVLLPQWINVEPFKDPPACRAVFNRLPEILGNLLTETATPGNVTRAQVRIIFDEAANRTLRAEGFRFAEPLSYEPPLSLIVNGNRKQRHAAFLHHAVRQLPISGLLSTWPQALVRFAKS